MIPNPTQDHWLKKTGAKPAWRVTKLMTIFQEKLTELFGREGYTNNEDPNQQHPIAAIIEKWREIKSLGSGDEIDEYNLSIEAREIIHDAIDEQTELLLHKLTQKDVLTVVVAHLGKVTKILDDANSGLNSIVSAQKEEQLLKIYFNEIRPAVTERDLDKKILSRKEKEQRNVIWASLMFRMLCWFLLHDWNKDDKCGVPPDLKGSRMPVYIG